MWGCPHVVAHTPSLKHHPTLPNQTELTEADFAKYEKKVKSGAKTAFIKGGTVVAAATAAPRGGGGGTAAAAAQPLAGKKRLRS